MELPLKVLGILQARVGSKRLPGKVLREILGKPMIERQIERILRSRTLDDLVVATTSRRQDDPIALLGKELGVHVVRGSETDVLSRFMKAICKFDAQVVVRLTADCPLMDPRLLDVCVTEFVRALPKIDYLSNTLRRTYPDGLDIEVISTAALYIANKEAKSLHEREHVTSFIHRRPERFALENVSHKVDVGHLRWTVDYPQDLEFVRAIYERLLPDNSFFGFEDVLCLLEREPNLSEINS